MSRGGATDLAADEETGAIAICPSGVTDEADGSGWGDWGDRKASGEQWMRADGNGWGTGAIAAFGVLGGRSLTYLNR